MKNRIIYMTLLSALALTACGKEEANEPEKDAPMTSSEYISFKVSASSPSESASSPGKRFPTVSGCSFPKPVPVRR